MKINVHGGHSLKCRGASGYLDEVNEDRKVKNRVIELLRENGHTVYDCTDDNSTSQNANLKAIVNKCNSHSVDLDVSIHLNAGGGTGTEVYVYSNSSKAKDEATRIAEKVSNTLGIRNRGVKTKTNLYVLRKTSSPALLVECCFVDNEKDKAHWNAENCAKAIVEGILNRNIEASNTTNTSNNVNYIVEITADVLHVRKEPTTNSNIVTNVKKPYRYTIVEERNGWGRLKSNVGWIKLSYTKRV
jgi:N-acetylmuramoyl-L-alanine amidase